jgi:hypothetical protein
MLGSGFPDVIQVKTASPPTGAVQPSIFLMNSGLVPAENKDMEHE